ncbi:MAG TPA: galactokinase [Phycisphaerales bacterium]|nr:galactokinase [Phycisphaerales bacterium]
MHKATDPHDPTGTPIQRARLGLRAAFGRDPAVAAAAPGRVNLIGEHTDYNLGFVLPMAIDRSAAVAVAASDGDHCRVVALDRDAEVASFEGRGRADAPPPWARYAEGVVSLLRARGIAVPMFDAALASSIPLGGGLSSSAAIEVAFAVALCSLAGTTLDPMSLAFLCQRAEHEFAGVPCGLMDQLAAVFGQRGHALLIDCRSVDVSPVPIDPVLASVLVVDSGVRHDLASGEYAKRRAECERAVAELAKADPAVRSLRDATEDAINRAGLDPTLRRRARHVVRENARTLEAARLLESGDAPGVGRLMLESHASLRDDYEVSCPELDTLVEIAATTPGVLGARMTGGGFGGCAVVLVEPNRAEAAGRAIVENYGRRTGQRSQWMAVKAADGARP